MTENTFMSGEDSPITIYYAGKKTPSIMLSYLGGVLHEEFYAKSDALLEMLKQKRRERKALLKTDDPEIPC